MVKLVNALSLLKPVNILVIGDMLLDSYTMGKARRISPEAPVAIVDVISQDFRPGGAGNVILNLLSLGANVKALGRVGNDWAGNHLLQSLDNEGVDVKTIVRQELYPTPVKNRIIADNQQIVRIDNEKYVSLEKSLEDAVIKSLPELCRSVQLIALSDYGKGFLTPSLLQAVISYANKQGIGVITDPKGIEFEKYAGTTMIKPNLSEAYAAAKLPPHAPLDEVAKIILDKADAKFLMITRSESGISLFNRSGQRKDFPVTVKEVKDVTGAGDTVLAMLSFALANKLSEEDCVELCNLAAGIAIEHVGCARVTLAEITERLVDGHANQKLFDSNNHSLLKALLRSKPYHKLVISAHCELDYPLFQTITGISANEHTVIVSIVDGQPSQSLIDMLQSLREVSFIVHSLEVDQQIDLEKNSKAISVYQDAQTLIQRAHDLRGLDGSQHRLSMEVSTAS